MPLLSNDHLTIEIAERGAELRSIHDAEGGEWLWHGDPAWWGGRAPLLFPLVGRSPDDTVSIAGKTYPMKQHGFARTSDFTIESADRTSAVLTLTDSPATREIYPFAFALTIAYRLDGTTLGTTATVENRDSAPMPFQFGFHPGFAWPLPRARGEAHQVVLGNGGEPPLHRLDGATKLLLAESLPSPFRDGVLTPQAAMFEDDAMLFLSGAGDHFAFVAAGGTRLDMRVTNLPEFALWQKPGAPYLCLEPWHGTTPFTGTGDALETRNGAAVLPPGETMQFGMDLRFTH